MQLKDYSDEQLMERKDELSVVMMLDKLRDAAEFTGLGSEERSEYLKEVLSASPEYLLGIIARMAEVLLSRLNVPLKEAEEFTNQIKERRMGELFSNFKGYDVQAARQKAYQEGEAKGETKKLLSLIKKKKSKNLLIRETANMLEEDEGFVAKIYEILQDHPDWDEEQIWEKLQGESNSSRVI